MYGKRQRQHNEIVEHLILIEGDIVSLTDDFKAGIIAVVNVLNDLAAKAKATGSVSDADVQAGLQTLKDTINLDDPTAPVTPPVTPSATTP